MKNIIENINDLKILTYVQSRFQISQFSWKFPKTVDFPEKNPFNAVKWA